MDQEMVRLALVAIDREIRQLAAKLPDPTPGEVVRIRRIVSRLLHPCDEPPEPTTKVKCAPRLSRLQKKILIFTNHLANGIDKWVPTKNVRQTLRSRGIECSDTSFSRSLASLRRRHLIIAANYLNLRRPGRVPFSMKPTKTTHIKLTPLGDYVALCELKGV